MTSPQQLDVLDLRHFNARQLRTLLEEEAALWQQHLHWDYRSATELLLQYLDSRILPGYVAMYRGRVVGYCFCVYEGHKAVIGDLYAAAERADPTEPSRMDVIVTLAQHLLETLEASPDIDRIEAQLLLFEAGALAQAFEGHTYQVFPRLFLEKDLHTPEPPAEPSLLPAAIEITPWHATAYHSTAELIQLAYTGHIDSGINDQYRTLAGSLRFLHNVIRFPGCGAFDAEASWLLRQRSTGALVGVLLCSRVAPQVAHITQLCIAPGFRGAHLGRALLRHCLQQLRLRGAQALTLTVTEHNQPAVRLYQAAGFRTRHRFDALVLEKNTQPKRFGLVSRLTSSTRNS